MASGASKTPMGSSQRSLDPLSGMVGFCTTILKPHTSVVAPTLKSWLRPIVLGTYTPNYRSKKFKIMFKLLHVAYFICFCRLISHLEIVLTCSYSSVFLIAFPVYSVFWRKSYESKSKPKVPIYYSAYVLSCSSY